MDEAKETARREELIQAAREAQSNCGSMGSEILVQVWNAIITSFQKAGEIDNWSKELFHVSGCLFTDELFDLIPDVRKQELICEIIMNALLEKLRLTGNIEPVRAMAMAIRPNLDTMKDADFQADLSIFCRRALVEFAGGSAEVDELRKEVKRILKEEVPSRFTKAFKLFPTGNDIIAAVDATYLACKNDEQLTGQMTELQAMAWSETPSPSNSSAGDEGVVQFSPNVLEMLTKAHGIRSVIIAKMSKPFARSNQSTLAAWADRFRKAFESFEAAVGNKFEALSLAAFGEWSKSVKGALSKQATDTVLKSCAAAGQKIVSSTLTPDVFGPVAFLVEPATSTIAQERVDKLRGWVSSLSHGLQACLSEKTIDVQDTKLQHMVALLRQDVSAHMVVGEAGAARDAYATLTEDARVCIPIQTFPSPQDKNKQGTTTRTLSNKLGLPS